MTFADSLPTQWTPSARSLLTRDDASEYLAISKRTLDRLVLSGDIPAYRIGGHRRFRREDLDSFVVSRRE